LNDAFLFLRSFDQLSDGQKYRYRIARLLESKACFWILDEFAATLDRDTAKIVSFNLQKIARLEGKCVIAATTHMDLFEDLSPSVHVHKRFGKEITVNYHPNIAAAECSLVKEMRVEKGSYADWRTLSGFHYRSHHVGAPRKIFALKRGDELCGVIVYCYPAPAAHGRRMVLPRMGMKEMNKQLCSISRVVVHPKYRTISLGAKLVGETLKICGTPCVEMSAVMAKYNPFAEKAGMRRIVLQEPNQKILEVSEILEKFGFNVHLLGSQKYIGGKLGTLTPRQVGHLKRVFKKNSHPRFLKELNVGDAIFGTREGKDKAFRHMKLPKLAQLIKITGLLLQTKVYLFWTRPKNN
jgi:energy-coupling factor transporter ATP-binding protein EcfA2